MNQFLSHVNDKPNCANILLAIGTNVGPPLPTNPTTNAAQSLFLQCLAYLHRHPCRRVKPFGGLSKHTHANCCMTQYALRNVVFLPSNSLKFFNANFVMVRILLTSFQYQWLCMYKTDFWSFYTFELTFSHECCPCGGCHHPSKCCSHLK